jgi:uncharacterized protein (UPF0261 family)
MRLNANEMKIYGSAVAQKLNHSKGPVHVLIPTQGFSVYSGEGGPFYDPESDWVFIETLTSELDQKIPVEKIHAHINDPEFSEAVLKRFQGIVKRENR